jgi:RNA polymerase sigma factor (sigma-70 family)
MPGRQIGEFLRRVAGSAGRFASASDRDVLAHFVADRDEAAFAELVRRHGGMVLGVCRRALGNTSDAEDACQATFLVLARKAAAIRRTDAVGAWLYGVARRAAGRLRARAARGREVPLGELPGPDTTADVTWRDGLRVLDEELGRLPEAYRAPLVLCYLEGKTQDEAARLLGWTLGAFRGRLERGRARLRDRLNRRGVGLAVLAAVATAQSGTAGVVPVGIKMSILKAAVAVTAGEAASAVPAGVAALAEGVITAMTVTKLQWTAGLLATCGLLTFSGVWAAVGILPGQGPGLGPVGELPVAVEAPSNPFSGAADPQAQLDRPATASQRQQSVNNLKQILLAIHNYADANGHLPADIRDKDGKPLLSWRVQLLPYLEQDNLYKQFKRDEPWDSEHNLKLLAHMPPVYRVGIEPKDSTHTYYQAFAGPGTPLHPTVGPRGRGVGSDAGTSGGGGDMGPRADPRANPNFTGRLPQPPGRGNLPNPVGGGPPFGPGAGPVPEVGPRVRLTDITDGTSNTIGVVEAGPPVPWTKPADIPFDPAKPLPKLAGPFSNVLNVAMMDGSAHALKRDIDAETLRRLIVMNDSQVTPPLNRLHVPTPAETAEEKEQLRRQIDENQRLIDQIDQLMKEQIALLNLRNGLLSQQTRDLTEVEKYNALLKRTIEEILRPQIKWLRNDMGLRPSGPVPKPPDRSDK